MTCVVNAIFMLIFFDPFFIVKFGHNFDKILSKQFKKLMIHNAHRNDDAILYEHAHIKLDHHDIGKHNNPTYSVQALPYPINVDPWVCRVWKRLIVQRRNFKYDIFAFVTQTSKVHRVLRFK